MSALSIGKLPHAFACLLAGACAAELLVGEKHCYGDGVDCDSDAPTLFPDAGLATLRSSFEVAAAERVPASWVYDYPRESPFLPLSQLARAPGGGVWAAFASQAGTELQRLDAEGEPVESHVLVRPGLLFVDGELAPLVLTRKDDQLFRQALGPFGDITESVIGGIPFTLDRGYEVIGAGPEGRLRIAMFEPRVSSLSEYDPLGNLRWRQSDLRDARDFPFDLMLGHVPEVSYQMITLSDGSIAVGTPKKMPDTASLTLVDEARDFQGIAVVGPDGNLRWDMPLERSSFSMLLAPGFDGGVVYTSGPPASLDQLASPGVRVYAFDRAGRQQAGWYGTRTGFYDPTAKAICSDPDGVIFTLSLTGERSTPLPTVCRLDPRAPDAPSYSASNRRRP